jgi:hypothetical protein
MAREVTRRQRTAGAAVIAGTALVALIIGLAVGSLTRADADPTTRRTEFTDKAGRVCTQVQVGSAVALDCDYKPAESRIGGLLNDLGNKP